MKKLVVFMFSVIITTPSTSQGQWRTEAFQRIETLRKSQLTVNVISVSGSPLTGLSTRVHLNKHAFKWGAAVNADRFNNSPHINHYKNLYLNYFNSAGFNNGLKPKHRGWNAETQAENAMPWFTTNNFHMRGHAMVWEGESNWKPNAVTVYNSTTLTDQQKGDSLVNMLDDHLYHVIPKWDVECWDVVNEPWGNQKVNELLPNTNTLVHWFKLADSLRQVYGKPNLQLAVNENSIIANNLLYGDTKIDQYMAILDTMIAKGAPISI